MLTGHTDSVVGVTFNHTGSRVATASIDISAGVWNWQHPKAQPVFLYQAASIEAVAFSPDDRYLATASIDGTAQVWDLQHTKATPIVLHQTDTVNSVAFSPDGSQLATASNDGTASLWDWRDPEQPPVVLHQTDKVGFGRVQPRRHPAGDRDERRDDPGLALPRVRVDEHHAAARSPTCGALPDQCRAAPLPAPGA